MDRRRHYARTHLARCVALWRIIDPDPHPVIIWAYEQLTDALRSTNPSTDVEASADIPVDLDPRQIDAIQVWRSGLTMNPELLHMVARRYLSDE